MPYWLLTALKRNEMSLSDLLDYNKLKRIVSPDNVSVLLGFQQLDVEPIFNTINDGRLSNRWRETCSSENRQELDSFGQNLSHSEGSVVREISLKFDLQLYSKDRETKPAYELVDFTREEVALVLYPGFFQEIKDPAFELNLARDMLKTLYKYFKQHDVSHTALFKHYVKLLDRK